jgi:hypothetical protein
MKTGGLNLSGIMELQDEQSRRWCGTGGVKLLHSQRRAAEDQYCN